MNAKAVALVSGGIDSILSIRLLQDQGIEIHGLNLKGTFNCCKDDAARTAALLGIPITILTEGPEYLQLIERPRYGWGHGVNPCTDCRIYMFDLARKFMEQVGASFVVSGEVLGQRPNSQRRDCFVSIERDSGLQGLILRPLSAQLLAPTKPETAGIVDRGRLLAISGRSRKPQMELAARYGIDEIPTPSTGCMLTEDAIANRIKDHLSRGERLDPWIAESMKFGRHFRITEDTKAIVGRNEIENLRLRELYDRAGDRDPAPVFLHPHDFRGPDALLVGDATPDVLETLGGLMLRYAKETSGEPRAIEVSRRGGEERLTVSYALDDGAIATLRIPDTHIAGGYRPVRPRPGREIREEGAP
jgi:tRNA-specific 2-thiouridylase